MSYQLSQPTAALRPYVSHLAISRSATPQTYQVLPDTALVIGFQYSGRLSHIKNNAEQLLHTSGITGLLDGYRVFKNTAETCSILIVFTATGAANFIETPLHELFGQSLSLEHFFRPAVIRETQEKLETAETDNQRLKIVEGFLLRQLKERQADRLVAGALQHIYHSGGAIRIKDLAAVLHTSLSPLEKRFRAVVGASPKKFAGIIRARHVLEALNNGDPHAEHQLAYYDQAHLIKDFKKFSSLTPEQYLRVIRNKHK